MMTGLVPGIQVGTMKLEHVKRVLVVNWIPPTSSQTSTPPPSSTLNTPTSKGKDHDISNDFGGGGGLEIRCYGIKIKWSGMGKMVKKIIRENIPDLGKYEDISDYVLR